MLGDREHAFRPDAGTDRTADLTGEHRVLTQTFADATGLRHRAMSRPGAKIAFFPAFRTSRLSATPYVCAKSRSKLAASARVDGNAVAPWYPRTPFGPSQ